MALPALPWLGSLLAGLLGTAGARVLSGLGLGLVTYAVLTPMVLSALNAARNLTSGMTSSVLQVVLLSGIGEAITMIGAAIMTRTAIDAGRVAIRKK